MASLLECTRRYADAAVRLMEGAPEPSTPSWETWVKTDTAVYKRQPHPLGLARARFEAMADRIAGLEERETFFQALQADDRAQQQIGRLVGRPGSWREMTWEELGSQPVLAGYAHIVRGINFNEAIARACDELVDGLRCEQFEFVAIAPLLGVVYSGEPFNVTTDVRIDRLTDDEMANSLASGIMSTQLSTPDEAWPSTVLALKTEFGIAKDVGGTPSAEARAAQQAAHSSAEAKLERALEALHAYKEGAVSAPGFLTYGRVWPVSGGWAWGYIPGRARSGFEGTYELDDDEAAAVRRFADQLEGARRHSVVDAACRRFSYATDRERDDDALVDLMIAAESLFLGGRGKASDKTEMRYRLALRAAFLLASSEHQRLETFALARRLYDLRSAIVHGGSPDKKLLKTSDGTDRGLRYWVREGDRLMRDAIQRVSQEVDIAADTPIDWEGLIFSAHSARPSQTGERSNE